jgi:hypothetical protein
MLKDKTKKKKHNLSKPKPTRQTRDSDEMDNLYSKKPNVEGWN